MFLYQLEHEGDSVLPASRAIVVVPEPGCGGAGQQVVVQWVSGQVAIVFTLYTLEALV